MTADLDRLAAFGGRPLLGRRLHVGTPNIGNRMRLRERFDDILDRRWLTNDGPYVQEFEARIAEAVGVEHCIAVCNATTGLEMAIRALGLRGQVIVPSFTFIATAHALEWQGISPIFCDVDPVTHLIDPAHVERLVTPLTSGIIGVHLWGRPCDTARLVEIAQRYDLKLLFDAAHAFGCSAGGHMIGTFGHAEVFSFHATKFLNAFEGGAIVTRDDTLAESLRFMRNFGFVDFDDVRAIGVNGKMTEISAAMGLTSLEELDTFIAINRRNYYRYRLGMKGLPGIRFIEYDEGQRCNYQYAVLDIDENQSGLARDQWQQLLWREDIIARRYFYPGCHRMEPYRNLYPEAGPLPHTDYVASRVLSLPTGTAVNEEDIDAICEWFRFVSARAPEVRRRLETLTPV